MAKYFSNVDTDALVETLSGKLAKVHIKKISKRMTLMEAKALVETLAEG